METPITAAEENKMYGAEVSAQEFYDAIARHSKAYDADDVQTAAYELAKPILAALEVNDPYTVGVMLSQAKKATCLRRAEFECYGYITTPEFKA